MARLAAPQTSTLDGMAELLPIALLGGLAIFIVWESLNSPKVSRAEIEKGFRPGWRAQQVGLLAIAAVVVFFGVHQWIQPSHPPFSGYSAIFFSIVYAVLGPRGAPLIAWLLAGVLIITVAAQWRKK
jgi:hypothetical protein